MEWHLFGKNGSTVKILALSYLQLSESKFEYIVLSQ